jgi:tRNA nucleotidyltransferase (CCA-adding enzyme)
LGKADSPASLLPKHHDHEEKGVKYVKQLCRRLHAPREYEELGVLATQYHGLAHSALILKPSTLLKLLMALDPFRKPARFEQFLLACIADTRGRKGFEKSDYPQANVLRKAFRACQTVDPTAIISKINDRTKIKEAIYRARLACIKKALSTSK